MKYYKHIKYPFPLPETVWGRIGKTQYGMEIQCGIVDSIGNSYISWKAPPYHYPRGYWDVAPWTWYNGGPNVHISSLMNGEFGGYGSSISRSWENNWRFLGLKSPIKNELKMNISDMISFLKTYQAAADFNILEFRSELLNHYPCLSNFKHDLDEESMTSATEWLHSLKIYK